MTTEPTQTDAAPDPEPKGRRDDGEATPKTPDSPEPRPSTAAEPFGREFARLFYESGESTWQATTWMGVRTFKLPLDLWTLQEIIVETRPDLVIETGVAEGGTTLFIAHLFDLMGEGEIYGVDVDLSRVSERTRKHPRVRLIEGSSLEERVLTQLRQAAAGRRVMVDLDSDHSAGHVLGELSELGPLVSPGCYLVVEDGILGRPIEPDFGPGPSEAVEAFIAGDVPFSVDSDRERLLATFNPGGYLRRTDGAQEPPTVPAPRSGPDPEAAVAGELRAARAEVTALTGRLAEVESELEQLTGTLGASSKRVAELTSKLARATQAIRERDLHIAELERRGGGSLEPGVDSVHRELMAMRLRLERIHSSLPLRIYNRLRKVPPVSWVARRRTEGFQGDFERARDGR